MATRCLEVIDFPAPYTDPDTMKQIADRTSLLAHNEIPAFQVDVGEDHFLGGTLAVQGAIEAEIENLFGEDSSPHCAVPFRFTYQNLRAPFFVRPDHARSTTMSPHIDSVQIGPAIHKEYVGRPTAVQFGHVTEGTVLPPIIDDYKGPDLTEFANTVYQGVTQLGRLSIFSQGNAHWNMAPTAHYFQRQADQLIGGRYTRYSMLDPAVNPYPTSDDYDTLVEMRKAANVHLDWQQWQLLKGELKAHQHSVSQEDHARYTDLVSKHLDGHPGENYRYWLIEDGQKTNYGVLPRASLNDASQHLLRLYPPSL